MLKMYRGNLQCACFHLDGVRAEFVDSVAVEVSEIKKNRFISCECESNNVQLNAT